MSPQEAFLAGIAVVALAMKETAESYETEDKMRCAFLMMAYESVKQIHENVKAQFEEDTKNANVDG